MPDRVRRQATTNRRDRVPNVAAARRGRYTGGPSVRGVVDEADVRAGKVQILAPRDFMDFTISENVFAGNAMNRRLFYQYGVLLPVNPYGYVTQGLGHGISRGTSGLIAPTHVVEKDIEEIEVDGVRMIFQNTPNTEAPSEMNTYIPEMKALWMAENFNATLHNIHTLRGALIRDALNWSNYINAALYLYGQEAEVIPAYGPAGVGWRRRLLLLAVKQQGPKTIPLGH
jgi:alkyl sulfatase BDS1-like metallo-beta-lactamase superfamily hydrolase